MKILFDWLDQFAIFHFDHRRALMSKPQNALHKPSKESSVASKKRTASVSKSKGGPGTETKGSVPELEPRITRRMSKLK